MTEAQAQQHVHPTDVGVLIETAGRFLDERFGEVSLVGSISGYKRARHVAYARLVTHDPRTNQPLARIPVVFPPGTRGHGPDLNGSHVAVTGRITAHLLYGPFQITVDAIEVLDAESAATQARVALRQAIQREGLDRTNKQRQLPYDANRLVVVCPVGRGAAGADVLDRLSSSSHVWDVTTVEVAMGGSSSAAEVAAAIERHGGRDPHAVLVCRGGGAPSDMVAFDSPEVAKAIVQAAVPVIVAVGHATDTHIADLVAHTSLPTPSAAADWLNQQRDRSEIQARSLVTKAAEATALAKRSNAAAAQQAARRAEADARAREQGARRMTRVAIGVVVVAMVVMLAVIVV